MGASLKNILIGLFVLLALGIIIFMLLFLHPSVGDNAKTLRVRFTDIDKVNIGTRVTFAGRPVGEVVSITEIPDARVSRTTTRGDVYVYELILKVDSSVDVFNTDTISLRTSGLLGERNIEIDPQPLKPGEKLYSVDNSVIYATPIGNVEATLKQFEDLSNKFGLVLDDMHQILLGLQQEKIVEKISHSMSNIVGITDSLNQPESWRRAVDNIVAFTDHINQTMVPVDRTVENLQRISDRALNQWSHSIDRTLQEIHQAAANARIFTVKADQIIENTRQGKGTLGQLFMGDDVYLRFKALFSKGSTIMDDIKTYGVLFHLDKKWQRIQAGRLKLLQKLSSPEEFANYFEREVDQINSSLSRVSMILNDSVCYPQSLMFDPNFITRFGELLRRVENMEEILKMYNESVVDQCESCYPCQTLCE